MASPHVPEILPLPTLLPLGDSAVLVRFADRLSDAANRAAIAFSRSLDAEPLPGVVEVVPNLVSVLLRYDALHTDFRSVAGELRLRLSRTEPASIREPASWTVSTRFGGEDGPDLAEVAELLGMSVDAFVMAHNETELRVLATGFAPGFVYCGMHDAALVLPRRPTVRPSVAPGSVLFAAAQTAITATEMPTGWHVIGRTDFSNFDPRAAVPTQFAAGDQIRFVPA